MRRDGAVWRGAETSLAGGSVELILRRSDAAQDRIFLPITGSIGGVLEGRATTLGEDVTVTFGGGGDSVSITGRVVTQGYISDGVINGVLAIAGPHGERSNCLPGTVGWSLTGPVDR
jgi:hypothetical protein